MQQWLKENSTPKSIIIERMRDIASARDIFIFKKEHTLTEILDALFIRFRNCKYTQLFVLESNRFLFSSENNGYFNIFFWFLL